MLPGLLKPRPLRTDQQGAGHSALLALGVSNMKRTLRTTSGNSLRDLHCWHTAKVFSADCKMHHVFHLHFKSLKRLYFTNIFPEASCDLPNQSPQNLKKSQDSSCTYSEPSPHPQFPGHTERSRSRCLKPSDVSWSAAQLRLAHGSSKSLALVSSSGSKDLPRPICDIWLELP